MADVVGHGILKHEASKDHVEAIFQGRKITKGNLLRFIEAPWRKAFSEQNVRKSYAAVGVWPFDPSKIKPAAVEPSRTTKVDGGFPVPVESPVKVIEAGLSKELAAMNPPHPPILTFPTIPASPTSSTPVNASTDSSTQAATGYHVTLTMMARTHVEISARASQRANYRVCWGPLQTRKDTNNRTEALYTRDAPRDLDRQRTDRKNNDTPPR